MSTETNALDAREAATIFADTAPPEKVTRRARVDSRLLIDALRLAQKLRGLKPYGARIPVLNGALIAVDALGVTVRRQNLSEEVLVEWPTTNEPDAPSRAARWPLMNGARAFTCCPRADRLLRILKAMPEGYVDFAYTTPGNILEVSSSGVTVTMVCFPVTDYPERLWPLKDILADDVWFAEGELQGAIREATPFISTEETRWYLNGVAWARQGLDLKLVATNGHMLWVRERKATFGAPAPSRDSLDHPIITRDTLHVVRELKGALRVWVNKQGAVFETVTDGDVTIRVVGKNIDGTFPDWTRVMPDQVQGNRIRVAVNGSKLAARLKPHIASSDERHRGVNVYAGPGQRAWLGSAVSYKQPVDDCDRVESFAADAMRVHGEGAPFWFAVNSNYLATIAERIGEATLEIVATKGASQVGEYPLLFECTNTKIVLMCMRGSFWRPDDERVKADLAALGAL